MRRFPDGNGWSKLNGRYTVKGDWLYWEDGDKTPNTLEDTWFTGFHGGQWDNGVDYSKPENQKKLTSP